MTAIQKLSVVVPCHNEEGNAGRFPAEVIDLLSPLVPACEFIFVDDGSCDGTRAALERLASARSNVVVAVHQRQGGLGRALRTGFDRSTGDAVLTLDADLTFHPAQTPLLLKAYSDGVGCVAGSPSRGRMENVSLFRRVLSGGVNFLYGLLLGSRLTSASSMFRVYRRTALKELSLTSESFDINAEIAFKLLLRQERIVEVPVTLTVRKAGESKIRVGREIRNHLRLLGKVVAWKLMPSPRRRPGPSSST